MTGSSDDRPADRAVAIKAPRAAPRRSTRRRPGSTAFDDDRPAAAPWRC